MWCAKEASGLVWKGVEWSRVMWCGVVFGVVCSGKE